MLGTVNGDDVCSYSIKRYAQSPEKNWKNEKNSRKDPNFRILALTFQKRAATRTAIGKLGNGGYASLALEGHLLYR